MQANTKAQVNNDIQTHMRGDTYATLTLVKDEESIEIPLIKFASQQAMTKGTIVIMSDAQSHKSTNQSLYQVAKVLPHWGWNTLLVTPQIGYFVEPLAKTINEEASPDAKDDSANAMAKSLPSPQIGIQAITLQEAELGFTQTQYESFIKELLLQIDARFLQQPGYKILVAQGKTASVVIAMLAKENAFTLNALVLNNPYWPNYELNQNIAQQIAILPMPVLDLVNVSDNHWSIQTRSQRLRQTRINVKPFYRQRELAGGPIPSLHKEYIAKEIVGWTRYLGW